MKTLFYTIDHVSSMLGLTRASVHGFLARHNYDAVPRPTRLGRRLAWPVETFDRWYQTKLQQAEQAEGAPATAETVTIGRGRPRKKMKRKSI